MPSRNLNQPKPYQESNLRAVSQDRNPKLGCRLSNKSLNLIYKLSISYPMDKIQGRVPQSNRNLLLFALRWLTLASISKTWSSSVLTASRLIVKGLLIRVMGKSKTKGRNCREQVQLRSLGLTATKMLPAIWLTMEYKITSLMKTGKTLSQGWRGSQVRKS